MSGKIVPAHEIRRELLEITEIPEHVEREESEKYRRNRHHLINELNLRCFRCGSMKHREVHHLIEWAFWNAVDIGKARQWLGFLNLYPWSKEEAAKVQDPDDLANLVVLCEACHRGKGFGLHAITFPAWLGEAVAKKGEDITPEKE